MPVVWYVNDEGSGGWVTLTRGREEQWRCSEQRPALFSHILPSTALLYQPHNLTTTNQPPLLISLFQYFLFKLSHFHHSLLAPALFIPTSVHTLHVSTGADSTHQHQHLAFFCLFCIFLIMLPKATVGLTRRICFDMGPLWWFGWIKLNRCCMCTSCISCIQCRCPR